MSESCNEFHQKIFKVVETDTTEESVHGLN